MKRSPLIDLDPIAFIDTSPSFWPVKRPDGTRLVKGDLIFLCIDEEVTNVYTLTEPSILDQNIGDAWSILHPDNIDEWMSRALVKASQGLYDEWREVWGV